MSTKLTDNKRIAKNTIIVYIRLLFVTLIGLLTSRFALRALGISDYGLYSIVGGIISLFAFISGSLSTTTIRFLNVEMGKQSGDPNRIFNICNVVHIIFALLLFIVAETVGVFYINNYLNVVESKHTDAMFVFQISTIVACIGIINVPYLSTFIAKEKFIQIAFVDIFNSIIKLLSALFLLTYKGNALRLYAILMSLTTLSSFVIYHYLSHKQWPELIRWRFIRDGSYYKQILVFNNYNILATISSLARSQGSNILMNIFFGTIVNGAYGIARTVQGFVESFMANFDSAAAPKIIQHVGGKNNDAAEHIVYSISRYCILMMCLVFFPMYAEMDLLLTLWLGIVPEYTLQFCKVLLIVILIASSGGGIIQYINASGNIKWFKLQSCFWSLLVLPIGYFLFKLGYKPYWILILFAVSDILNRSGQLILLRVLLGFNVHVFLKNAWIRPFVVILIMTLYLLVYSKISISSSLMRIVGFLVTAIITILIIWFIGLYKSERNKFIVLIKEKFSKYGK